MGWGKAFSKKDRRPTQTTRTSSASMPRSERTRARAPGRSAFSRISRAGTPRGMTGSWGRGRASPPKRSPRKSPQPSNMRDTASRTEGEVQIRASQGWTGEVRAPAMIWRMAGGPRVWISPARL